MPAAKFRNDLIEKNERQTKGIPLSSLKQTTVPIDNLYSSVEILERERRRGVTQRVVHPKDIFYIGSARTRHTIMIGLPARGKTAYCQWLTYNWCKARRKYDKGIQLTVWESGLNEFDFLFFVRLRNMSKRNSVVDMICSGQFKDDFESQRYIENVLKSEVQRCLIIFDGLDELNPDFSLPDLEGFPNCSFFITTRPWKFSEISHIIDERDRCLEIKGLDHNGMKEMTEKILCNHYHLEKTSEEFVSLYDTITHKCRISAIKTFMHIPLLAIICVQVLYENRFEAALGSNITSFYIDMIDLLIKRANKKGQIHYVPDKEQALKSAKLLTPIISKKKTFEEYSEILLKLAKLAFEGLTLEHSNKLVMDKFDLAQSIGEEHLQFAFDVGILSQSDENACFNKIEVSVSFFHKSVQEALAAIHISVVIGQDFIRNLTNTKKILEYSNVIMFVCGLKRELGKLMLKHIADIQDKDVKVSRYREELLDMAPADRSDIYNLFRLQVDCFREMHYDELKFSKSKAMSMNTKLEKQSYHVSDVLLEDYEEDVIGDTAELLNQHLPSVKSAYFSRVPVFGKKGINNALLTKFLDDATSLTSLFISGLEQGRILHHLRLSTLTVLSLMYVTISDVNPVDGKYSLVPLLHNMNCLEELKLNHITLGNKKLGINPKMTQMKKVVLQWVNMCCWGRFFQSLTEINQKYEVKLSYSDADDESMKELYESPHFQITWYGGKSRTHFYRIPQCNET